MRPLFTLSMLLAGLWMTALAPTASLQRPQREAAGGNTCDFGDPLVAATCANVNGNRGQLGSGDYGAYGYHHTGPYGYLGGNDIGAYGKHTFFGHFGYLGGDLVGVYGQHNTSNWGALGGFDSGAYGVHNTGNRGALGNTDSGAYGKNANDNLGYLGGSSYGAYGQHDNDNAGFLGGSNFAVYGQHHNANTGWLGSNDYGAYGRHVNGHWGALGRSTYGAYGAHNTGHWGALGGSIYGVHGRNVNNNRGYLGHDDYGVWGTGSPWAGYFAGNVQITGTLTGGSAASKVDHPLDPAGKYLSQSFVESPEMKTIYDGTVVLDAQGEAVVELPAYVEALNRDFRYQLTCVGGFAPVYVAEKISGNRFKIAGGASGMEVSWLVTGIRHDAWANEHRLVVEEAKPPEERGRYLHPALYGQADALRLGLVEDDTAAVDDEALRQHIDEERRQIGEERQRMQAEHDRLQSQRPEHPTSSDDHR